MKSELELLREWVKAEIAAAFEAEEEDESGYRGCSNSEQKNADELFNQILTNKGE